MSGQVYPMMPGVPAAGHVSGGAWHPGPADGCGKCPAADGWRAGEPVTVTEYRHRRPRPGGRTLAARVTGTAGLYVLIRYDDPDQAGRRTDQFYASSGWRASDGELRWRLHSERRPPCRS